MFDINDIDLVIFTETWSNENFNYSVPNFKHHTLHRVKNVNRSKRSSGGLIVYIHERLSDNVEFLKTSEDCVLWVRLKNCSSSCELANDVLLCVAYNVPKGSSREVFIDRNIFDIITNDMLYYENMYTDCQFVITGDFNARISNRYDFVIDDDTLHVHSIPDDYVQDVYLPRFSQDKNVNEYGNYLLEFCKATGLRVVNGRLGLDANVGKYTCVNTQGASVVDYVLCKQCFFKYIHKFAVHDPNIVSDHCF